MQINHVAACECVSVFACMHMCVYAHTRAYVCVCVFVICAFGGGGEGVILFRV